LLGLSVRYEDGFALVLDAKGTMLRVQKVQQVEPRPYTVLGWEVADGASVARRLAEAGVKCERFEGLPQDELGIWTTPDGSRVAWFRDPDGNLLSLTQFA
jgi:catechol 2,3-dioxygenase-like lactoylglutathione lyase family enzyme